jgi:hypothetical protein
VGATDATRTNKGSTSDGGVQNFSGGSNYDIVIRRRSIYLDSRIKWYNVDLVN